MIYLGLDDTDVVDSPGTNQLARHIARQLADRYRTQLIVRHQLLQDPQVACTSKNGCASMLLEPLGDDRLDSLKQTVRELIAEWAPFGSDPGLCVTTHVPEQVIAWGNRCQREWVTRREAYETAAACGVYLEGLGGTNGGVIGALAAVGLVAAGNDGRIIHRGASLEDYYELSGWQTVDCLQQRGIDEVRCLDSQMVVSTGTVDVGKRLRPNYRQGRAVLYVSPAGDDSQAAWHAVRVL